jgi:ribosome-associated translation inhibitor RaiA
MKKTLFEAIDLALSNLSNKLRKYNPLIGQEF